MEVVRQEYVEFLFPGSLFVESQVRKVKDRSLQGLEVPEKAYGFLFFTLVTPVVVDQDAGTRHELNPKREDVSGMHYPGGKKYTPQEITELAKEQGGKLDNLVLNMEDNKYPAVVRTRRGNWQPFTLSDQILP